MTDKPKITLKSLKTKSTATNEEPTRLSRRGKKKIIKRADIAKDKLTRTRPQAATKPKKKAKPQPNKKPVKSPSQLRMEELDASLNAFGVWLNYQPLALGIEKQIFQHIAKHSFSSSKRVVQKLLRQHTRHQRYLQAIQQGGARFNLDGSEAGEVLAHEQNHAGTAKTIH